MFLNPTIASRLSKERFVSEFANDVNLGLGSDPKCLKPRYFYDSTGSDLFEEICHQPEYYVTKTEAQILEQHAPEIASILAAHSELNALVELGSGSSVKTKILLDALSRFRRSVYYLPIDISHSILQSTVDRLSQEFPKLQVIGLSADYVDGIDRANQILSTLPLYAQKTIIFFGSSIGNFEPENAQQFLKVLASKMGGGDKLLIGFDLHKSESVLNAAYNDYAGITAKFNLNILHRINNELAGQFNPDLFEHYAFYNKSKKRIEMHLVSKCNHLVYIGAIDRVIEFGKGETIHTESSYKYTIKQIDTMAKKSNLRVVKHFTDKNRWFDLALFERKS